jgi:hypothetical protein
VNNRVKGNTIAHHPQNNTNMFYGKPLREKIQLECEVALLSFLWYENNASTKEKEISMELHKTYDLLGYYIKLTPYVILSNYPLPFVLLYYGKKIQ